MKHVVRNESNDATFHVERLSSRTLLSPELLTQTPKGGTARYDGS